MYLTKRRFLFLRDEELLCHFYSYRYIEEDLTRLVVVFLLKECERGGFFFCSVLVGLFLCVCFCYWWCWFVVFCFVLLRVCVLVFFSSFVTSNVRYIICDVLEMQSGRR